jgi:hypothetical protein
LLLFANKSNKGAALSRTQKIPYVRKGLKAFSLPRAAFNTSYHRLPQENNEAKS